MSDSRAARSPGFVYGALALGLVVLLAAIALTTRQPPPPTIAEFAPQAVDQIRDAPVEQSSEFGSGSGVGAGGSVEPTPEENGGGSPRPRNRDIPLPRVRSCVGDPPRQIEDPQSPPCVPYWEGDNGGATHRGVDATTIKIFVPTEGDKRDSTFEPLKNFFNRRFEFYGRKLQFVYNRNDIGTANPDSQRADAIKAAREEKVFASTFYRASQGFYYHEALSKDLGTVNATGVLNAFEGSFLLQRRPYAWQYYMEADRMFANVGEWACKRLVGHKAQWGGDTVRSLDRLFGVIIQTYYDGDPTDTATFEREMSRCGHPIPAKRKIRNGVRNDQGGESTQPAAVDPVTSTNVILQMKGEGVTTIFCPCNLFTAAALMKAASQQNYFPEWIFTTYGPMDINVAPTLGAAPPEQMAHAFGLTFQPRQIAPEREPYWWAIKEVDPNQTLSKDSATVGNRTEIYRPLLLLAAGIQMAGPTLTPETFERGLQRAMFPNPLDHPNKAGKVGFAGRYAMTLDGAEIWWSTTSPSPFQGDNGVWCYVDGGQRYTKGEWPSGPPDLFAGRCDSGAS